MGLRIRAHDALRVALAIRTIGDKYASLNVIFDKSGQPTELFNTDNYCVAYVPATITYAEWDAEPVDTMKFWVTIAKIPAKPRNDFEVRIEQDAAGIPYGGIYLDGDQIATLQHAGNNAMTGVRNVVPANLEALPIAHPAGLDVIHAASILKAAKKPPQRSVPVQLPGGGIAYHFTLEGGGEFIMVGLRGDEPENKRFAGILSIALQKAPF